VPRRQTTVAALGAGAGAGGAVLSACFDIVLARPSINLNYHYGNMGLSGSELRSLVLPLRAGRDAAERVRAAELARPQQHEQPDRGGREPREQRGAEQAADAGGGEEGAEGDSRHRAPERRARTCAQQNDSCQAE
jgi:putative two-component system hydrogenase maturation factor HypX/HoxX